MGMTGDIVAGGAWIRLLLDDKELKAGLQKSQTAMQRFSQTARQVGTECMTLAAALAAPLMSATRTFANFDDQMRTVAAVTGATGDQFDALTEKAKKLGRETSFTAAEVAGGMTALGRMGFSPEEIDAAIGTVMNLARATGTDLATAAEIASNNLRAFGLSARDTRQVADILTVTANASAQTLTDLGEALKTAAPAGNTAGESIKDVSAALGVLANVGIRGSVAGNALKRAYSELAKESSRVYLEKFGVRAVDATGNLRRMADVMRDCAVAMKQMGSAQKMEFATQVFGERAAGAALAITVDTTKLDDMMAKLDQAQGVAAKTAEAMEAGVGGELRRLSSAAEGVALAMGKILAITFGPTVGQLAAMATALAAAMANAGPLTSEIIRLVGHLLALGAAVKVFGAIKLGVTALFGPLKMLTGLLGGVSMAMPLLTVALAGIVAITAAVRARADEAAAAVRRLSTAAQQAAQDAGNAVSAGNQQRREDAGRFARLEELYQLSKQGKLTAEQLQEVELLFRQLERYNKNGQLGQFDATRNGFGNFGESTRWLFEQEQVAQAGAQMAKEYAALQKQLTYATGSEVAVISRRMEEIRAAMKRLQGGDVYAARGQSREAEEARAAKAASDRSVEAKKAAAAADERLAEMNRENMNQYDRELEKLSALQAEYEKLAQAKMKALQQQQAGGEDTTAAQEALRREMDIRKQQYESAKKNVEAAKASAAAKYTDFTAQYEAGQAQKQVEEQQQKALADAISAGDTAAISAIETQLQGQYDAAKKAYADALAAATGETSEGGTTIAAREAAGLRDLQGAIKASGDRLWAAREQIRNGTAGAQGVLSSYSGAALARMFAGNGALGTTEQKALKAQEDTAKNTKKLTEIFGTIQRA